jgi:hypothetical protein
VQRTAADDGRICTGDDGRICAGEGSATSPADEQRSLASAQGRSRGVAVNRIWRARGAQRGEDDPAGDLASEQRRVGAAVAESGECAAPGARAALTADGRKRDGGGRTDLRPRRQWKKKKSATATVAGREVEGWRKGCDSSGRKTATAARKERRRRLGDLRNPSRNLLWYHVTNLGINK